MPARVTKEELLAKAQKPAQDAMNMHPFYRGKMQTSQVRRPRFQRFCHLVYPGRRRALQGDKGRQGKGLRLYQQMEYRSRRLRWHAGARSGRHRSRGRHARHGRQGAVVQISGRRGCRANLPGTKDPDEIIQAVKWLQPSFGGINLEDISNPKCFYILDTLRKECRIPVWHDDQQGTAAVTLAGFVNALKMVGKR